MENSILIIDDDIRSTKHYGEMLQDHGFEVLWTSSVEAALRIAQDNGFKIGCVVLDVMMPPERLMSLEETSYGIMTGVVFLERFLMPLLGDVPVIVVTASDRHEVFKRLREFGDRIKVIRKPFSFTDLIHAIQDIVGSK